MEKFRTIEISDPRFECNGLKFITVKSANLKGRGDICVFVPEGATTDQQLPLVILLHGVYGSAWSWSQQAGVHLQAAEMIRAKTLPPMILAMPSDGLWGDGSAYLSHHNINFEKWIAEDVVMAVRLAVPAAASKGPLFIGGLSMGGYGALLIGVKYNHLFRAISVHSSIVSLAQMQSFVEEDVQELQQKNQHEEEVFETIVRYKDTLPHIRFDCGTEDSLIEHNRALHASLTSAAIVHEYHEYPGSHVWAYWEKHIIASLQFFARYFDTNR